ncbi:MAG: stage II sporulation protein M [Minisyncoccales bacterium]
MLRSLFSSQKSERKLIEIFLIGFFYASISILLSLWVFPQNSSLAMVFLSVLPIIYVLQATLRKEEQKEEDFNSEKWLLKQHLNKMIFFFFLFLGFVFAFGIWAFALGPEKTSIIFEVQTETVEHINHLTGGSILEGTFFKILSNNLKVMLFSIIFALFYGAGAIFILAWNASVMGLVIGVLARNTFGLSALPLAFTKYLIHGIPEMFAYLCAAIAGGIFFIAVLNEDILKEGKRKRVLIDISCMIALSIGLLVIAAIIEIYVSPLI